MIGKGGVPYDGTAEDIVHSTNQGLQAFYSIWSSLGLIYCIFCMAFNIYFRNRRLQSVSFLNERREKHFCDLGLKRVVWKEGGKEVGKLVKSKRGR